jgi:hypothetical protein
MGAASNVFQAGRTDGTSALKFTFKPFKVILPIPFAFSVEK